MSEIARRGELVKLSRVLGQPVDELAWVAQLDVLQLRAVRDAISARLFDDARPTLQRVAAGSRLLPNALTARVGEAVFGPTLCAQIAGLLDTPHALALALRMSDRFLAQVSASIDPRRAGPVIAQIPAERVVAVAQVMLAGADHVTLARFVDHLAPATIAAVIASIPDELVLLQIGAYVESPARLRELVESLDLARTRAMIAALRGANGDRWFEALAIADQLDEAWRRTLGDLAAAEGEPVVRALIDTAHRFDVWPAALRLVLAMGEPGQRAAFALIASHAPAVEAAVRAAADSLGRRDEVDGRLTAARA